MTDCFVHASDLHLDAPLASLGSIDEETRSRLADEAKGAWNALVNLTIEQSASFLVLAGDVFDDGIAHPNVQRSFLDGLRLLGDSGIPVLISHGNHDPLTETLNWITDLPPTVTVFPAESPTTVEVALRHGGSAFVSGLSFAKRAETENLALRFHDLDRPDGPHIAVLHANLDGDEGHDPYAPCSLDDLRNARHIDYWALGHIHLRRTHRLGQDRYAAYCGNLQGRKLKPSECHPKGALIVPIDDGKIGEPQFFECDRVRFVIDEIEVVPDDDIEDVLVRIEEAAGRAGFGAGARPVVWSFRLTGRHAEPDSIRDLLRADGGDSLERARSRLNGGGIARSECRIHGHQTLSQLIPDGSGFRALVFKTLDQRAAVGGLVAKLIEDLPASIKDVFTSDREKTLGTDATLDEIVERVEEILVAQLGSADV